MYTIKRTRKDLYANSSDVGWDSTEQELQTTVYADGAQWCRFLRLLLPAVGVAFMASGIVFFFAFNWSDLNKFAKLGLVEGVLLVVITLVLFTRWSLLVKQIILMGACMLVGVLFAVGGQIYQTGANGYDFFLAWTLFVTLWVVATHFLPLWLYWIGLVNVTIYLYRGQMMAIDLHGSALALLLDNAHILLFAIAVALVEWLHVSGRMQKRVAWFVNTLVLQLVVAAYANSIAIISRVHYDYNDLASILIIIVYGGGLFYGYRKRHLFYIATILFAVLLVALSIFAKVAFSGTSINAMFSTLIMGLMVTGGTTGIVFFLIKLKKRWYGTTTTE